MHDLAMKLALIGAAGIGAQWLAWRLHLPAIVLLLIAGFLFGPVTGFLNPVTDFGELYRPLISLAVAVILFEGGLTLNFAEIKETSKAVRRIILFAGPMIWAMTAVAAHYVAGLSWPTASVIGAILVVTGPTVIMPLLRQAQLTSRAASLLRWEAIVNDPIGALFAVIAFEVSLVVVGHHDSGNLALIIAAGFAIAVAAGWIAAQAIRISFIRGHVPEFLKAPVMLAVILVTYASTNHVLEETGLLAVTIMGIVLANSRIASLTEMRRFKETITVLLVSGLFIILTASLTISDLQSLDLRAFAFVALLLFIIRPIAIILATIGTGATWSERVLTGWIAPRGVVAVAVSGLFGAALAEAGIADANQMIAMTFAVVVSTIVLHGFSLGPLARLLNLKTMSAPGLLIVGGSPWSTELARKLQDLDVPVIVADNNWNHLAEARLADVPVFYGEVLSEYAHHALDPKRYSALVAATDNDAYNALVCTDFGPELGRSNVFQLGRSDNRSERQTLNFTLGGRSLLKQDVTLDQLAERARNGWTFQSTRLSEEYSYDDYLADRAQEAIILMWIRPSGHLVFAAATSTKPGNGDRVISYAKTRDNLPVSGDPSNKTLNEKSKDPPA